MTNSIIEHLRLRLIWNEENTVSLKEAMERRPGRAKEINMVLAANKKERRELLDVINAFDKK